MVVFVGTFVFPIKCNLSTKSFQVLINLITLTDFTDATTRSLFPFDVTHGNDKKYNNICMVKLMYYT